VSHPTNRINLVRLVDLELGAWVRTASSSLRADRLARAPNVSRSLATTSGRPRPGRRHYRPQDREETDTQIGHTIVKGDGHLGRPHDRPRAGTWTIRGRGPVDGSSAPTRAPETTIGPELGAAGRHNYNVRLVPGPTAATSRSSAATERNTLPPQATKTHHPRSSAWPTRAGLFFETAARLTRERS